VLVPLVDIAADVTHPVEGRSLRELLEERPGWRRGLRVVSTFSNA
jgi:7,8-dihydro-6-hydroxymethylpterin-pyrophosphokinase